MIDYLKENWKTVLVGAITFVVVLLLCCCESKAVEEIPVVEEVTPAVEEVTPAVEEVLPEKVVE